jgi:23S rRNA pseudouridine1911/1915/1917 synthase
MSELDYYRPLSVKATEREDGMQVRTVLERRLGVSRKLLSKLKLTELGLTVNDKRVFTSDIVRTGDVVTIRMEKESSDDILPEPIPIDVVFEDEDVLVVNKPPGIIVHPTHGHYTGTLANGVVHYWRERGETVRFRPIHRLDEHTSGLVVIAKTPYVHQQLSEQLQADEVDKRYLAFVHNKPTQEAGTVDGPIDRDPERPHLRIVTPDGYPSVTHYETVAVYESGAASCVRLKLETGRTHQIRVHMKSIGCPLIGDDMYGLESGLKQADVMMEGRQALHAESIAFTHPITRERMKWTAALPDDMRRLEHYLQEG